MLDIEDLQFTKYRGVNRRIREFVQKNSNLSMNNADWVYKYHITFADSRDNYGISQFEKLVIEIPIVIQMHIYNCCWPVRFLGKYSQISPRATCYSYLCASKTINNSWTSFDGSLLKRTALDIYPRVLYMRAKLL